MRQTAHVPIFNNKLYEDVEGKLQPANYGPLDPKMVDYQFHVYFK